MGPVETQRGVRAQDGSGALLFPFPHAWPPLKEVQHSPIPLLRENSWDGQHAKGDPFLNAAQ